MAMRYDPRTEGARCDECPMKRWHGAEWAPVPGTGMGTLLLTDAPGPRDKRHLFAGEDGTELNDGLNAAGISRANCRTDAVIACRLPKAMKGKWDLIGAKLRKEKKQTGVAPPHPAECCAPRLQPSLDAAQHIVALGGPAASRVLGGKPSIMGIRGTPITLDDGRKVFPTLSPGVVRAARRWRKVFAADLSRARRFFEDRLLWSAPRIQYTPRFYEVVEFFSHPSRWWSYDVETDARDPLQANLRCIAISRDATPEEADQGYPDACIVIPFRSLELEGEHPLYDAEEYQLIVDYLRRVFTDGRLWCGHNAGWYDRLVIEEQLSVTPKPLLDTILLARLVASELPKSLGVVGSMYIDLPSAWKQDNEGLKLSVAARTDMELWEYCALDTAVTHRCAEKLVAGTRERAQAVTCAAYPSMTLVDLDHKIQDFCAGLTRTGMYIDREAQRVMEADLTQRVDDARLLIDQRSPIGAMNPASVYQVRDVLYSSKGFGLDPVEFTDAGDPSTNDASIRAYLMRSGLDPAARSFLLALRTFRKAHKLLTGFVRPLKLRSEHPDVGVLDDDGRLRVAWSAHVPVTGRLSSSQPMNVQNWPKELRKLVIPAPGNILVGADYDQLEGRIGAARWGLKRYLEAYATPGIDPHQITMEFCFGQRIWSLPGAPKERYKKKGDGWEISGKFNELRQLAKSYYYAKQYSSGDETVHGLLQKVEDTDPDTGEPIFPNAGLKVEEVAAMSRKFLAACPELERGWKQEKAYYDRYGCNVEPLTGRRRDFLDGFDLPEVVNFPVQASGAALMNIGTVRLIDAGWSCNYAGPGTGPIQQGHDALVVEVPEAHAEDARRALEWAMTQEHRRIYDVVFSAEAEIGRRWYDV